MQKVGIKFCSLSWHKFTLIFDLLIYILLILLLTGSNLFNQIVDIIEKGDRQ